MYWKCPYCDYVVRKATPQGLGMAKENHLRKHGTHLVDEKQKSVLKRN